MKIIPKRHLPNLFIQVFKIEFFNLTGFPIHVDDNSKLWKYVDSMHDLGIKSEHDLLLLVGVTHKESELMKNICKRTYDYAKNTYNNEIVVKSNLLLSVLDLRKIHDLSLNKEGHPIIFEVGVEVYF